MATILTPANHAYDLTFRAVELAAASANIDMRHLHHRYHATTAAQLLRREAAACLRNARAFDRATTRKIWARHIPQARAK